MTSARRALRAWRMAVAAGLAATACATAGTGRQDPAPEVLVASEEIPGDFLLEQQIRFRWDGGAGSTRALIQHLCGDLSVVLLTPLGTPGVVIQQRGTVVEIERRPGARLPFDPARVLRDIHRGLFVRVTGPPLEAGHRLAALRGGERVEEIWNEGRLVARIFHVASDPPDRVRVTYPDGFSTDPAPAALSIDSEGLGYQLEIATLSSVALDCSLLESLPGSSPRW